MLTRSTRPDSVKHAIRRGFQIVWSSKNFGGIFISSLTTLWSNENEIRGCHIDSLTLFREKGEQSPGRDNDGAYLSDTLTPARFIGLHRHLTPPSIVIFDG